MNFPVKYANEIIIDYQREREGSEPSDDILKIIIEKIQQAKPQEIRANDNSFTFKGGISGLNSHPSVLAFVEHGVIAVSIRNKRIIVKYELSFNSINWLGILFSFFYLSAAAIRNYNIDIPISPLYTGVSIGIAGIVYLITITILYYSQANRFAKFLNGIT